MKNKLILLFAFLITGCASSPVIKTEIQRVEIPIPVSCTVAIPAEPDFNFNKITANDTLFDKVKSLLADRELSIGYQLELLVALKSRKS